MRWIIQTSLRFRYLVVFLAAAMMLFGIVRLGDSSVDVFPEFAPPLVEIQTEVPGLSTEEVESLVTLPLENSLNGLSWLKTLRSKSVLGLSSVVLIFQEGTDVAATQAFREISRVTKGAHVHLDTASAATLGRLLRAVAAFAAVPSGD